MILINSEHLSGKLAPPGRPTRAPVMFSRWNFRAAPLGLLTLFMAKAALIEGALPGFTSANWVGLGGTEMQGTRSTDDQPGRTRDVDDADQQPALSWP